MVASESTLSPPEVNDDLYLQFVRAKILLAPEHGFPIDDGDIHPILFPHQRDIVRWAVRGGCRALFASFGLGKSLMQLEICRLMQQRTGGKALIVCPLGVRQEFMHDAAMLTMQWAFIRRSAELRDGHDFYLTNYESVRDGKLDPSLFTVVSLDEAAVLRSYGSKTYQEFLTLFRQVPYKFVATATPSPNRYKEIIHYGGFLGIMDTGEALTRFFQRDSTQANNLTLYPHQEKAFWLWLASWAVFVQRPSDLGYPDTGYALPPLQVHYHEIPTNHAMAGTERDGQGLLFKNAAAGLPQAAAEKRDTLPGRLAKMREILQADPASHYVIWHDLERERHAIQKALPDAISVYGTQDMEQREAAIVAFAEGHVQYLSTKPSVAGCGTNLQRHCHKMIFLGIGYKFYEFFQSIHRLHRFLQAHQVEVHIISSEAERDILRTLQAKWSQHMTMMETMSDLISQHGLASTTLYANLARSLGIARVEVQGSRFTLANNDAILEARRQPDASVGLIVTSIPFANHYEYTPAYEDMGHTKNNAHFWQQMDFLTPELLRILQPGRMYCCHVKDRINFGNVTGAGVPTVSPFHAEAIFHAQKHGFDYLGMITVVTDVVRENNQTYRLGWTEQSKDGTKMGVGSPEYVLLFRKPQSDRTRGYADVPVVKSKETYSRSRWQIDAHAFWRSSGDRFMTAEELGQYEPSVLATLFTTHSLQHVYNYEHHVKIGEALDLRGSLPSSFMTLAPGSHQDDVWHDIHRMKTLNTQQAQHRAMLHVCPLQLDIIDRLITRYSNPDDVIYDPFMGLGSVAVRAIALGRYGRGSELNSQYFLDSIHYCQAAEDEVLMPTLFALEQAESSAHALAHASP